MIITTEEQAKRWKEYERQYELPRTMMVTYDADRFGNDLTYNQMTKLYSMAVDEVLLAHNVMLLSDISYGRGFHEAHERWVEKIKYCLKIAKAKEESKNNK